jgi:hypothetical protein
VADVKVVLYEVEDWVRTYLEGRCLEPCEARLIREPLHESNAYWARVT